MLKGENLSRRIIILFIVLFLAIPIWPRSISFYQEDLAIYVNDSTCTLKGHYFLKNNTKRDLSIPIYYPIAIDETQNYPDYILLRRSCGKEIKYQKDSKGIGFSVNIPADSIISIYIEYEQYVYSNNFEYIVESTRSWGEALKKAKIEIHLPHKFRLLKTSFSYNKVKNRADGLIYIIERNNFYPDKNVIIEWERKKHEMEK